MRKRPEKTEQTKSDLKEAFWRLYSTQPIEKITVGQVCELAGYNRTTFYAHFQDLHGMLAGISLDGDEKTEITVALVVLTISVNVKEVVME